MSDASKATIPINWVITSSEFRPNGCVELKLGNIFNDLWILKLYKKPLSKYTFQIFLSLERKKAEKRIMAIVELQISDVFSNRSTDAKYVKKFQNVNCLKISYNLSKVVRKIFSQSERVRVSGEVIFHLIPNSGPIVSPETLKTLATDLNKLCCSSIFSDVILRCGSEVFTAHKNILATRCPFFDEMFANNVSEEIKIDIKDLAPHILKAVLLFIYSGELGNMNFQLACDLLSAADKYRLNELKELCVVHITSSLSVENVLDYFHKHEVSKSYAMEFIVENISEIKRTKQWEHFSKQYPDIASKILKMDNSALGKNVKQECPVVSNHSSEIQQNIVAHSSKEGNKVKLECPGTSNQWKEIKQENPCPSEQGNRIHQVCPASSNQSKELKHEYSYISKRGNVMNRDCPSTSHQRKRIKLEYASKQGNEMNCESPGTSNQIKQECL